MAEAYIGSLPADMTLYAGCIIRVNAIDPFTGAAIPNVVVSNVSLFVTNQTGGPGTALESGPFKLVPGPGA